MSHDTILILDFGSQYSHLIARRIRELGIYCELHPCTVSLEEVRKLNFKGIVLSGGPNSVYERDAPHATDGIWDLNLPVLGICYGLQELSRKFGGQVSAGEQREYGHAELEILENEPLFAHLPDHLQVWMSHGDKVQNLPNGFLAIGRTSNSEFAAIADHDRNLYGIQFHPEVTHTPEGKIILRNFAIEICGCRTDWSMGSFVEEAIASIREKVGEGLVIGAVSGGVDSTVAAVLMNRAIGERFHGFLIDNGLLRLNEAQQVMERLKGRLGINLTLVDASERFLQNLEGVTNPEKKRRIIGNTFIEVFEEEAEHLGQVDFLLQGTLYPDVIESVSFKGPSATIKTHHNVGGLLKNMRLKLIEPLRELFKDEVRELGSALGLDEEIVYRQPFPGPGLAVRILGDVTEKQLDMLRQADAIFLDTIRAAGLYRKIGQAFAVLLPIRSVGVMGDSRTYEQVIALRAVQTTDYMTADWYPLPDDLLRKASNRIINEVRGVNRVVYDISSKPPSTIEWE
ncbi:MAG: glutamine-hydrolyzing GMP synthase [Candidatus Omnitrophota bacterium]|jgi:GMP synthase (glutamine-hydrolysing)|nr:MAG: glutamine-hydrolyzing GMP synthase [Candidatus Omnitrophota bacterium]